MIHSFLVNTAYSEYLVIIVSQIRNGVILNGEHFFTRGMTDDGTRQTENWKRAMAR